MTTTLTLPDQELLVSCNVSAMTIALQQVKYLRRDPLYKSLGKDLHFEDNATSAIET